MYFVTSFWVLPSKAAIMNIKNWISRGCHLADIGVLIQCTHTHTHTHTRTHTHAHTHTHLAGQATVKKLGMQYSRILQPTIEYEKLYFGLRQTGAVLYATVDHFRQGGGGLQHLIIADRSYAECLY